MNKNDNIEDRFEFVESLRGTCRSLNEHCESYGFSEDDLTDEETDFIDSNTFRCEVCDWWCEVDEIEDLDGQEVCTDCKKEAEEQKSENTE